MQNIFSFCGPLLNLPIEERSYSSFFRSLSKKEEKKISAARSHGCQMTLRVGLRGPVRLNGPRGAKCVFHRPATGPLPIFFRTVSHDDGFDSEMLEETNSSWARRNLLNLCDSSHPVGTANNCKKKELY